MPPKVAGIPRPWFQGAIQTIALVFAVAAVTAIVSNPELRDGRLGLEFAALTATAAVVRRFGIQLPGKGFASFLFAVIWIALLLRPWHLAVLVGGAGTLVGDGLLRRLRGRAAVANVGHVVAGTGVVGLAYDGLGGGVGAAALSGSNAPHLLLVFLGLPLIVNAAFYYHLARAPGFAWVDARITVKWEVVTAVLAGGLALGAVLLITSDSGPGPWIVGAAMLAATTVVIHYAVSQAVTADELRFVRGLADAVAGDVSLDRGFDRIQELTGRLVPWEHMGFARFDEARDEMELVADTSTSEKLRFPAHGGVTGEAVQSGMPVVSSVESGHQLVLPEGESPGSEILVPLQQGGRLVGLWSVRHSEAAMYRSTDAELLNLLAPQLALALSINELVSPIVRSSRDAAASLEQLEAGTGAIREAAEAMDSVSGKATAEAEHAADRLDTATEALTKLSGGIDTALANAVEAREVANGVWGDMSAVREASRDRVAELRRLRGIVERGIAEVTRLREAAAEVEGFSDAIATIANQTNLLALNATIEAARAGVHGRGFRVVAEEVGNLADESGRAARNMGKSAENTRKVIDGAASLLDDIASELAKLAGASEQWATRLAATEAAAGDAGRIGAKMVDIPSANRTLTDEAHRLLGEARRAASGSAGDAAAVSRSAAEQLEAVARLTRHTGELRRLATQLAEGAQFLGGAQNGASRSPGPET